MVTVCIFVGWILVMNEVKMIMMILVCESAFYLFFPHPPAGYGLLRQRQLRLTTLGMPASRALSFLQNILDRSVKTLLQIYRIYERTRL